MTTTGTIFDRYMPEMEQALEANPRSLVIRMHRHQIPQDLFGYHVLVPQDRTTNNGYPYKLRSIGLFNKLTDAEFLAELMLNWGMCRMNPALIAGYELPADGEWHGYPNLLAFIIHQVCPIEWQARMDKGDEELLGRIEVLGHPHRVEWDEYAIVAAVDS